jgi:hypothetical protein
MFLVTLCGLSGRLSGRVERDLAKLQARAGVGCGSAGDLLL